MATTLTPTTFKFNPIVAFGIPDYTPKDVVSNANALMNLAKGAILGEVVTKFDLAQLGLGRVASFSYSQMDSDNDGFIETDFVINFAGLDRYFEHGSVHVRHEAGNFPGTQDLWVDTNYADDMFAQSADVNWHLNFSDGTTPMLSASEDTGLNWKNGPALHSEQYADGQLVYSTTYLVDVVGVPMPPMISPI